MKKWAGIIGVALLALAVATELFVPTLACWGISAAVKESLHTDEATVSSRSFPAVSMLFGRLGHIDIETHNAMLGDLRADDLALHGEGVKMPSDVLTNNHFAITDAKKLELAGVVTEEGLQDFLQRKVDKLRDAKVVITEEQVIVDAAPRLMGTPMGLHLEGNFFVEDNKIRLALTKVTLKATFFGRDIGGDFGGAIDICDFGQLNMPVELDAAKHEKGRVVLTASRHPGKVYGDGTPRRKGSNE